MSIIVSCGNNTSNENTKENVISKDLKATDFEALIAENQALQLVDVRTWEEYSTGHLTKSINMDFNKENFKEMLSTLDKSKPIAVYCKAGGRSEKAKRMLIEMGFKEVYNMEGGILEWQSQGLPLEK
ncbi:MAG: hypothetical protein OHK0038_04320 [Flammeovirgaceae bacterium]